MGQHVAYIQATKDMCDGTVTSIKTNAGETKNAKELQDGKLGHQSAGN